MSRRRVAHRYCVAMSDTTLDTPSGSGSDRLQIIVAVLYFGGIATLFRSRAVTVAVLVTSVATMAIGSVFLAGAVF
jgi:hypothetical protein